ncbi:MAG: MFS transporter [Acidobacteriota bacterium]|jgi:FSR family fosmidomycin resistance protein-like MFS transporter
MQEKPKQMESESKSFFWTTLPFFIIAHAAHHFLTALPQPLLPAIRDEFKLSYTGASFVPTAFAISGATGQLPAGWLADRVGPKLLIAVGTIGVALAGILVGFSQSFVMLISFLLLMGLVSGGYHPAATPLISASVKPQHRGRALGLHLIGGNSSFFLAPIIAGSVLGVWGWRGAFFTLAVPTILFGLIFFMYLGRKSSVAHVEGVKQRIREERPPQPGYKRRLIAFLTMVIIGGGAGMSILSLLTLYMTDELGASNELAAGLPAIVFSSGIWAGPLGGYLADKFGSVKIVIITGIFSGIIIYALNFVSLGPSLYLVLFLQGLNMAIRMPVTEVFVMSQTPAKNRSTIFGVYYSTMQYTGAIFTPLSGVIIERWGFHFCFKAAAIAVLIVAVITSIFIYDAKDNYHAEA